LVHWQPAVDVIRAILGAQIVAIVALLAARAIARVRHPTEPKPADSLECR
jgi:hypothetical protein